MFTFKRLIEKIKGQNTKPSGGTFTKKPVTDEEFYTELFTKDEFWSTPTPNSEEQKRWAIIQEFLAYIKKSQGMPERPEILDLGCGRGWLTNLLSGYGPVTGIEPIKPVVEYARKMYPNIDFLSGSSGDLLEKGMQGKFDIVVSSEVIEHVPDENKPSFIRDINTLLKPGGFTIITTPRKEAEQEWLKYCAEGQPVEDWITEPTLKSLFEAQGFGQRDNRRLNIKPNSTAAEIEIYQLWLFQKNQ